MQNFVFLPFIFLFFYFIMDKNIFMVVRVLASCCVIDAKVVLLIVRVLL